jgi:purine-nucleoside phosphorylase
MSVPSLAYRVREAVASLRDRLAEPPRVAIVLGSGLGWLADGVVEPAVIPYSDIPHFSVPTAPGHSGQLVIGTLEGVPVAIMRGRLHYYEGHSFQDVTFPIRTLRRLGAETLLITNAAGGVNQAYETGDLMVLSDHINLPGLAGLNPLVGPDEPELGVRFLDLTEAYDAELRARALAIGAEQGLRVHEGTYAAVSGPSFETPAEVRYLRTIGADAVGMSTASEVIVARHERMRVLGISAITNAAAGVTSASGSAAAEVSHEAVLDAAERAGVGLTSIIRGVLRDFPPTDSPS